MENLFSDIERLFMGLHAGHKRYCNERRPDRIKNYCSNCGGRFVPFKRHILIVINAKKYA